MRFIKSKFIGSPFTRGGGIGAPAAAGLTSIAQQASATSTASTITCPTVIAGDVIVLLDWTSNSGGVATTAVPSGFTQWAVYSGANVSGFFAKLVISYKLALGTESGSTLTGCDADDEIQKRLVTFRGDIPITATGTAVNSGGETTNTNPTAVVAAASGGTPPLIVIGGYAAASSVDPRTMSPAKDGEFGSTNGWIAWKIYMTSPADVTIDMDDEGNLNSLFGGYLPVS